MNLPAGVTDPAPGNNTANENFAVSAPSSDLSIAKSKGPNPVAAGGEMTSTITVRNNGPSVLTYGPGNPLRIVDTVTANETYASVSAPWSCATSGQQITCELAGPGTVSVGGTVQMVLKTTAGTSADMDLSNTACTGTTGGSSALPGDGNAANDCAAADTRSTTQAADLTILKEVSLDNASWTQAGITVPNTVDSFYIRLTVGNLSGNTARNVVVSDPLPNFLNTAGFTTGYHQVSVSKGTAGYTASSGRIEWRLIDLAVAETQTLVVRIDRPVSSGTFDNIATIASPDTTELVTTNNTSTARYTIVPIADMEVNNKALTPNSPRVGVLATYNISVRNVGPNPASAITVVDTIDPARFELVGNPTTTKSDGTCTKNDATGLVECAMGTMNRGDTYQISQQVRARYPFGGLTSGFPHNHTNTATVATSTRDSDPANNAFSVTNSIAQPQMDLAIVKTEPSAAFDPMPYGEDLQYDIRVSNFGPSRATNIIITDTPAPPAGYTLTLVGQPVINPVGATGGMTQYTPPAPSCVTSGAQFVCKLHGTNAAQNYLDPQRQVVLRVTMRPAPIDPLMVPSAGSLTFTNSVSIVSEEQDNTTTVQADLQLANNSSTQTTTVLPSTDLEVVSKDLVTPSPAEINQPVEYRVVVRNNGPSPTTQLRVSDQLPAGWVGVAGGTTVSPSGTTTVSGYSCSGGNKIECTLNGMFPATGDLITLTFFAKPNYPYSGALNTNLTNTAEIKTGLDGDGNELSRDTVPGNNSKTEVTQVTESSIAGFVYRDNNLNNAIDAGEGLTGVAFRLTGTDALGAVLPARTVNSTAGGAFIFNRLPAGTYTIVETQPAGMFDRDETAGTAGGIVNNTAYSSQPIHNTISNIVLGKTVAATGYIFQEIEAARVSGYIYSDVNNNGVRDAGETGFPPARFTQGTQLRLTGTDYAGNPVDTTAAVDAAGAYLFTNVPPSAANIYTVTQTAQPTGTSDGLDANGLNTVIAGSGGRGTPEDIVIGTVAPAANLTERNFGELETSGLGGIVFLDPNNDAIRDTDENSGLAGAIIRLTGTNDLAQLIDCVVTTTSTGLYNFPNAGDVSPLCQVLRPGSYELEITPALGLTHTGAYLGSLGGTSNGVTGTNAPSLGAAALRVTGITVLAGSDGTKYDFGAIGQGLSGSVYIDRNASGMRDAGEAGIPGVTMTLSGTTAGGQDVCTLISCTAQSDATGAFIYLAVPGSDATGYTLTEQAQNTAPLSSYADGQEAVGNLGGVLGNDVISGIILPTGALGTNYNFGELAGSLSGSVFVDANNDGVRQPGEVGIEGVVVTLSGTTKDGDDICTWRAALEPALSCTLTTGPNGNYVFEDMPEGDYTLVETQPGDYADGREGTGTAGGTVDNSVFNGTPAANTISNITLGAGEKATDYVFGERAVVINGNVYKDIDRDGTRDPEDTPIGGVVIELYENGVLVGTTTTDADGNYSFTNLPSGDYTIRQTQPDGYGSSTPNEVTINLTPGVEQSVDFGETVSSIAGHVFVDANNDGIRQAGEAPIIGVVVTLTGTDDAGAAVTRTATTNALGEWVIDDLKSGTYQLVETQPDGYSDGEDSAGSVGGTVEANADRIYDITLPVGTDATDYAFGERGQSLTGNVYVDADGNGSFGPEDRPLGDVVVELRTPNGDLVATTTTNPDGSYSFGNIRGGDYIVVEIQPEGYGEGRENPSNRVPVKIVSDQVPPVVNFGERTGSLSGLVYNDTNNNGVRETSEPVIGGVSMTLTGTDARGEAVTRTTVTLADGTYVFTDLQGGTYSVFEAQPDGYDDGIDTPGTAGGASDGVDTINQIVLAPAMNATGYLFGERGAEAAISGTVWMDSNHNRALDGGEDVLADWTVELFLGDVLMGTTQTGTNGDYAFTGVAPGTGYLVRFRHPQNNAVFGGARPNENGAAYTNGTVSPSNLGGATIRDGELTQITLQPGASVPQQSLPLDPWGVVYDSVRRTPVQGAIVEINGPAGFDPAQHLLGGEGGLRQVVDAKGLYYFQLVSTAPAGVYTLTVTPPNGTYNPIQPSSILPPCVGTLTVNATPDPMLVSTSNGPPPVGTLETCTTGTLTTGYVLTLNLTPGVSANVVNNNIPLDPILEGAIEVTKTTPMVNVVRGGLVPYVITARNTLAGTVPGVTVTDRVPAGFRYREGSALLDGVAIEPIQNGRLLSWPDLTFTAGETKRFQLILVVGAGVGEGEHTNTAFAMNPTVDQIISNIADATVRMIPDPDFDCTDILGKVFDDRNGNGVQDDGEPGLGGVRLATARGLLITTDAEGRYHITCPMIPNEDRGSNFIVKLDDRTLPTGYRVTSGNPETVRLTRGKFARLNFGASLHRVVRLDLNAEAFEGTDLRTEFEQQFETLLTTLAESPSVLRLAYASQGEDADVIRDRIAKVRRMIRDRWNDVGDRYRLVVEEETVIAPTSNDGGVQ